MKFAPIAIAAAALVALPTLSSAETFEHFSAPGFVTETTSVVDSYLMPVAPVGSTVASYSVLSPSSGFSDTATVNFASPITSFTFLWGSPDSYNLLSDGTVSVTGSTFSSGTGNNAESTLYTFVDAMGFNSLTFSTTGVAFEVAVSPVPEPETYALLLAGLGALGFVIRRRKRGD